MTDPEAERVAVEVYLTNPGTEPWTAAGAVLRGPKGEVLKPLLFWQTLGNVTFPEQVLPPQWPGSTRA
ncbi:hypothetical protein [Archangium sp.]|uniref:hypothetical protein n=1 Tax=Archangium sp. TaxID=1872627 RepID=UPI002D2382D7|nr:hypothetical protein [Archangium sp.]HYO58253.1 hypothetical protein [Archangium sp.]